MSGHGALSAIFWLAVVTGIPAGALGLAIVVPRVRRNGQRIKSHGVLSPPLRPRGKALLFRCLSDLSRDDVDPGWERDQREVAAVLADLGLPPVAGHPQTPRRGEK